VQTWQLVQCSSSNTSFSYIHAAAASPAREDTSLKYDTSAVVVRHISKICSDSHVKNVGTDCMVCWHENTLNETKRPPLPNHTSLDSVFVGRTIFIISSSSCLMMRLRAHFYGMQLPKWLRVCPHTSVEARDSGALTTRSPSLCLPRLEPSPLWRRRIIRPLMLYYLSAYLCDAKC
jgi:hypothetical protein